jgi:CheY-like chemotaxis protein
VRCDEYPAHPKPALADETASLNMAHDLATLSGSKLELLVDSRSFRASLIVPAVEKLPVLVIDDNADTLQLLQRYATGTRYHLVTTQDQEQAFGLAESVGPQVIVLDVMMPEVDGWEVLGRLRQNPVTAHIPIIVCTILAQSELATFLGASDFLRKPVSRDSFLAALDRQTAQMETAPR